MEKIRFLNNRNIYDGEVSVRGNVIAIKFHNTLPPQGTLTNGFELLNENNGFVQGNYTAYTTIYWTYEDNNMLIELSCDGPIRPPYIAFLQGGLTYEYGKLGVLKAIQELINNKKD